MVERPSVANDQSLMDGAARELTVRLTPGEMGAGILVANRNARRLISDGILLFEQGSYPSASALAMLAMEEAAKWWTLVRVTVLREEKLLHGACKESRRHELKLATALKVMAGSMQASGVVVPDGSIAAFAQVAQELKLRCIYTAFVTGRRWVQPPDVVDAAECRNHLGTALVFAAGSLHLTGKKLGEVFGHVPGLLDDEEEEAAKKAMIAWSQGEEAAALAAKDEAEAKTFGEDARRRLQSSGG